MRTSVDELAAAGAALAATLAGLHERGQVHGAVDADHAILGPPGAVALKPNVSGTVEGAAPEQDVSALGRLLLDALGTGDPFGCLRLALTARERQGWRRFLPLPPPASPAAALRELALEAAAATADGPTASTLSKRFARVAGHAGPGRRRPPAAVVRATALAVAGAAVVVAWSTLRPAVHSEPRVVGSPATAPPSAPGPGAPVVDEAAPEPSPSPPAARLWPPPPPPTGACPGPGGSGGGKQDPAPPGVAGENCRDTVVVSDGIVRSGSRRFAVGSPGDLIVLGDWNCDQATTPAVLRPSTGGLFVFDQWAGATESQRARPVRVVEGAVGLEPRGCGHAAVHLSDGSVVVVDTSGRR